MYHVYILTNAHHTTLYTGITGNLAQRIEQHKNKLFKGFTQRYNIHKLVYVESTQSVYDAIQREKQIKGWDRAKKIRLIETLNPTWDELMA